MRTLCLTFVVLNYSKDSHCKLTGMKTDQPPCVYNWSNVPDPSTARALKLMAFHKMGTKLSQEGAYCINSFLERRHINAVAWARGYQCTIRASEDRQYTIHFSRHPISWILSNYLYHWRGDAEPLPKLVTSFANVMAANVTIMSLHEISLQPPNHHDVTFSAYLRRVSLNEGLRAVAWILALSNVEANQIKLTHRPTNLQELVREGTALHRVCLSEFGHSTAPWLSIMAKVTSAPPDEQLVTCLKSTFSNLTHVFRGVNHGTHNLITPEKRSEAYRYIDYIDRTFLNSRYALAADQIQCLK